MKHSYCFLTISEVAISVTQFTSQGSTSCIVFELFLQFLSIFIHLSAKEKLLPETHPFSYDIKLCESFNNNGTKALLHPGRRRLEHNL